MKRKILLTVVITCVLACLFALGICAAGKATDDFAETPDTIEGVTEPTKIGTTERVVLVGADGLYYTYPAYYILEDNTQLKFKQNKALNVALGYEESKSSLMGYVVRIEIPDKINFINHDFESNKVLKYAKMPDTVTDINRNTFKSCSSLETLILSKNLKLIPNDFCKGCSSLTAIEIPASVTAMNGYCFDGCTKLSSVINHSESITSIPANAFSGCPIANEFNFPDALTSIGTYAFSGAKFTSVDIPNGVTTMGSGVFQSCTNLTYVRFPESLTEVPHDSLKGTSGKSITVVVPKGCTSINSQYSLQNTGISKIIFTGTPNDAFVASVQQNASSWVSKITYENHCLHYYNNVHKFGEETMKFTGEKYLSDCICTAVCQNCELDTVTRTVCGPMIKDLGYSKADYDPTAFTYDILVDKENIASYEKETGLTLSYGFIVGSYTEGDSGDILGTDNVSKIANAIVVNFAENKYDSLNKYNLKMVGVTESLSTKLIYCNGFVNDGEAVTYLGAKNDEGKAFAISLATLPKKEEQ